MTNRPEYLTVSAAARRYGASRQALRDAIDRGRVPSYQIPIGTTGETVERVVASEVADYFAQTGHRRGAAGHIPTAPG